MEAANNWLFLSFLLVYGGNDGNSYYGHGGVRMRAKTFMILCLISFVLIACQRFEKPADQTGLDKDSHSYTHMSYDESRMKQAAMDVPGVSDVRVEYDFRNLVMFVTPDEDIRPNEYKRLAERVYRRVSQTTPITPIHVKVVPPDKVDRLKGEPQ